jgi:uncharacterized protein
MLNMCHGRSSPL